MQRQPNRQMHNNLISHLAFPLILALLLTKFQWPIRWVLSGCALLNYCLILGEARKTRILAYLPLWTLIALVNLTYAVAATSWLLYGCFILSCYPTIFLVCLFQFQVFAGFMRQRLGLVVKQLHFINDKVAFFDIPALEIDTDVEGLLVIRGITISLTNLSLIAHGVEVGIKLSDDIELAIQVDEVEVMFFRNIEIGDVYANLKGGEFEMTFGKLARQASDNSLFVSDTPLLQAAALKGNTTRPDMLRTASKLTNGAEPEQVSFQAGLGSITQISPHGKDAELRYQKALEYIDKTSSIKESIRNIKKHSLNDETRDLSADIKELRAAVCSQLHDMPSVPHPPLRSVKVTTLQNLSSPYMRRFLHRLPFLLRLLLNPLSYFHPIGIRSITAAGSGKWLQHLLSEEVFRGYGEQYSSLRRLEQRISAWLADANFVAQMVQIRAGAHVPLSTTYDVTAWLKTADVLAYRTLPQEVDLKQVVRMGGADASAALPSFLLPHHEHILPPIPNEEDERRKKEQVETADGMPKKVHAQVELEQLRRDETNIKLSVHASLPAVFDQELLNFTAALVKATKVIEMEKDIDTVDDSDSMDSPTKQTFKQMAAQFGTDLKGSMRRAGVEAVVNDRWIAKLVGKLTKTLETVRGDVGWSGDVPIALQPYRALASNDLKLLP